MQMFIDAIGIAIHESCMRLRRLLHEISSSVKRSSSANRPIFSCGFINHDAYIQSQSETPWL